MFEGAGRARLMGVVGVMLLAATACSTSRQSAASGKVTTTTSARTTNATLTFSQSGCAFDGPGAVWAGPLTIHVVNAMPTGGTPEVVYTALLSIDDTYTYGDLVAWHGDRPPKWATTVVDGETAPGEDDELTATVTAGTYGLVCFTPYEQPVGRWNPGSFTVSG